MDQKPLINPLKPSDAQIMNAVQTLHSKIMNTNIRSNKNPTRAVVAGMIDIHAAPNVPIIANIKVRLHAFSKPLLWDFVSFEISLDIVLLL